MGQQCLDYPDRPCYGLEKARELEERINNDTAKNTETHREMYERIRQLEIASAKTDTQYGQIMETLGALKTDIADMKSKPGRRWEAVVDKVIFAAVGAIVAYFLAGGTV